MSLARRLADALLGGSSLFDTIDFKRHLVNAYISRLQEMNTPLGRLALFLDPRFREFVFTADTNATEKALLFKEVLSVAHLYSYVYVY
jgi:hypothetical protein